MASVDKEPAFAVAILLIVVCTLLPRLTSSQTSSRNSIQHHDLFVQLDPDRHSLMAVDRLTIAIRAPQDAVRLSLAPTLQLDRVLVSDHAGTSQEAGHDVPFEIQQDPASPTPQYITIPAAAVRDETMIVTALYHVLINDPPKEPRHLRFVTPSETAGHIGSEGVYLSSESQWYPDMDESLSTY